MDRKKFSGILDEAVGQLENEVRVLKNQQANITTNLKDLEDKRNKLSQEIYDLGKKKELTIKETQEEKEKILKLAQDKLNSATAKDTEVSGKLSELNKKLKEADDLIKSNRGLQGNLALQNKTSEAKIEVLKNLVDVINATLKDM